MRTDLRHTTGPVTETEPRTRDFSLGLGLGFRVEGLGFRV